MTSSKSTKRALLTSALAILMCVAMLIGTTFAWFTDTASTAVNKIQSGNLDVALEMSTDGTTWESAEGKTLTFKTADNRAANRILWEPGCTYELPQLRVVNKGNLALKYKIQITGIQGDAKLNEVIDWTINDAAINLTEEYHLLAGQQAARQRGQQIAAVLLFGAAAQQAARQGHQRAAVVLIVLTAAQQAGQQAAQPGAFGLGLFLLAAQEK